MIPIATITAPNPGPYTLDGTRTYILGDSVVIDPGPEVESHIDAIGRAAPNLTTILVTHRHADHAPAAATLRQRTGATIHAPAQAGLADHVALSDGGRIETLHGAIVAIATPGHTAEHFCFLTADGDLFTGDTILGEGTTTIFPPDGDMGDYLASLRRLRALAPRRIFPGHGPVREDAIEWIDYYIRHRMDREAQIVASLSSHPVTLAQLRLSIYPTLASPLHVAAELQLEAHLKKLATEGVAVSVGERWKRS